MASQQTAISELPGDFISPDDMLHAYRKAKVDVFFERSQPMSEDFCEYEKQLLKNLDELRGKLLASKPTWFQDAAFVGDYGYIPKRLKLPEVDTSGQPHFGLSDPEDAWNYIIKNSGDEKPSAEFRPVALLSVDMYVVSALWTNLVGHKYDACLGPSAFGSRVRRLRADSNGNNQRSKPTYHLHAPGSFQPYFYCYREWREQGLKAIRHELEQGRRVVAVTMDLASFYHNIDPTFLIDPVFLKRARFRSANGQALNEQERTFTSQLISAFDTWARKLPTFDKKGPCGIPVGPSAPRIIANVLLAEFDRLISKELAPIYYGRYVDDIFLVLRDTGSFDTAARLVAYLARRIEPVELGEGKHDLLLKLEYAGKSRLAFKAEKQRIFLLSGEIGQDLLDTIENKIDEVSSEWRLLPNLDDLNRSPAARVLTAAKFSNEDADSLRKADELSLRRLGFALMLRSVDALTRDLPANEWSAERKRFYRFAERHVLTPLRIFELYDYLPRLLGVAVACRDWSEAQSVVSRIASVIKRLRDEVAVTPTARAAAQWAGCAKHLARALVQAVITSFPLDAGGKASAAANKIVLEIEKLDSYTALSHVASCPERPRELFWSDLGRTPFKDSLLDNLPRPPTTRSLKPESLPMGFQSRAETIHQFLEKANFSLPDIAPLVFPTRPLNPAELTESVPETVVDTALLRSFVQALRGTWVKEDSSDEAGERELGTIDIGRGNDGKG